MARLNRTIVVALALSAMLLLAMVAPASALSVIKLSGKWGDFGYQPADDSSSPAGICGYSGVLADNFAHLRWIKVRAPIVVARDITAGRDHQTVSWQVKIQRQPSGGGAWKTIASSAVHSGTAYDNQTAPFNPIKVFVNGKANQLWRALIILKWWRNGLVEGSAKGSIDFYGVKWTVGSPSYVYTGACDGEAD